MLLAALLAMMLVASSPAWAQQTSGPATANPSVDAAGAGNVAVQQVQNVNTGNVNQEQTAANVNEQIGFQQVAEATATSVEGDALAVAANVAEDVNVTQTQTVDQNITQTQQGISQTNNAFQFANQTLNR
jgi:hypothetical protein